MEKHSMTDIPVSYELAALDCAVAMLCGSAQWQTITGGQPRSRIVFYDGGDPAQTGNPQSQNLDGEWIDTASPLAMIDQQDFPTESVGTDTVKRSGAVAIDFVLGIPGDLHPANVRRWCLGVLGTISQEIWAQRRKPGKFAEVEPSLSLGPIQDATGALGKEITATITLNWKAIS
jgi:hypothetical protein